MTKDAKAQCAGAKQEQRGYINVLGKYYNRKELIKAGFFVENGVLRHKGELR